MPQMAPLWWFILYMMFIASLLLMCIIMYFQKIKTPSMDISTIKNTTPLNWKW